MINTEYVLVLMQHILQASVEHDYLEAQQKSLTEHVEDPYWAERRAQLSNQWARAGVSLQLMQEGVRIEDAMRTLQDQLRVRPIATAHLLHCHPSPVFTFARACIYSSNMSDAKENVCTTAVQSCNDRFTRCALKLPTRGQSDRILGFSVN